MSYTDKRIKEIEDLIYHDEITAYDDTVMEGLTDEERELAYDTLTKEIQKLEGFKRELQVLMNSID